MDANLNPQYSGKPLDHLGIIADVVAGLDLVAFIDQRLPLSKTSGVNVTHGERIFAMILNGLGFIDTRLYMFPEFLEKRPVERLFGRDIKVEWFNDDSLGRCLDAIAAYGATKLFSEISFYISVQKKLFGKSAHVDTSTLTLYGSYPETEGVKKTDEDKKQPKHGFSKSKRHDLKQMIINLVTTGQANFPIWFEAHSGNVSDKNIIPKTAEKISEYCKQFIGAPNFIYVGDSAMYSNILQYSGNLKWLSRVPESIKETKVLLSLSDASLNWHPLTDGYSYHATTSEYKGIKQRWIMIFSEYMYAKELKTLDKAIIKEKESLELECKKISAQHFSCSKDAQKIIKAMKKKHYHIVNHALIELTGHDKKGRPSKDAELVSKGYKFEFSVTEDPSAIAQAKIEKGRFILATNVLDTIHLPDNEILAEYKGQAGTESGFKFIKDDAFELDSVFLKTPSRIEALMMVMTLCLMVYGIAQYTLRQALIKAQETIPNQLRKPTNKPTMKWVFRLFHGVHELKIITNDVAKIIVINVNALLTKIINFFGERAKAIYFNTA